MNTYTEQERAAYMAGDYKTATAYAKLQDLQEAVNRLIGVMDAPDDAMVRDALQAVRRAVQ
jgi:ribosomal protein L10